MIKSKYIVILLATFLANSLSAQTTTITQLLQKALQQENKARKMIQVEIDSLGNEIGLMKQDLDSLEVTELAVKKDTLLYITKHHFAYEKGYYLEQQKVALQDIRAVTKDIGIFFETAPDTVQVVRQEYFEDGGYIKSSRKVDLFRTHFVSLKDNEYLADELINAFKKAGYKIEKGPWYD
ncbi:hypothetical protein QO190_12755 [Cloacibacterium sp. Arc13]|uniref:hypothetical protein n=1 Tax=unclassified Cloacibacterium TaxID=2620870 RepID=UPI00352F1E44